MNITILGLSVTSSWGNGHATTYRSLIKGLFKRGHKIMFLERDVPWYSANRDLPDPEFCSVGFYNSLHELKENYYSTVEKSDVVIVGSYVPEGISAGNWILETAPGIKAFYDIDTPVTIRSLRNKSCEYLTAQQIPKYDIYLSFSAGPCLKIFKDEFGSPDPQPLYCSVDPELYYPVESEKKWDLGYLGTYSDDRQPVLTKLFIDAALKWKKGRFIVAGAQYPKTIIWPPNIQRSEHLAPDAHRNFYNSQRYTLNITRKDMVEMGYSPSVRLFEAAACGVPVIGDHWEGLESVFNPGKEIFVSSSSEETLQYLREIPDNIMKEVGDNAKKVVLGNHTGEHRALELEKYLSPLLFKGIEKQETSR